jgi:hypothetical protein
MTSAGLEHARGVPAEAYLGKLFDLDALEALIQLWLLNVGAQAGQ